MIKKIWEWTLIISTVVWLFLPMPFVVDPWGWGKNWWLLVLGMVNLLFWLVIWLRDGKGRVRGGMAGWWWMVTIFGGITLLIASKYLGVRVRGVTNGGGLAVMAAVGVWWWLWQQMESGVKKKMVKLMAGAGVVLALVSLVVFVIPQKQLPLKFPTTNPWLVVDLGWSATGTVMSELVILLVLAVVVGQRLARKIKKNERYWGWAIVEAILVLGVAIDGYKVIKGAWAFLPLDNSWAIALESLKRNPWTGVGWGNFIQAFNVYRPAGYNLTPMWATAFRSSTITAMQWLTEGGFLGLAMMIWGVLIAFRKNEKGKRSLYKVFGFLSLMLMPVVTGGWWIVAWLLALKTDSKEKEVVMQFGENKKNVGQWVVAGVTVILVIAGGVGWVRLMLAEAAIKSSLAAAAKNQAQPTYDWQRRAIQLNPWEPEYRRLYSQTNLALAQGSLAKENPSEAEKQQAAVLVQQSVNEAKAAIALDGLNSTYWTNLAVIYRSLVGLVDGAADWSYESYNQAVALDPVNPLLKLNLGGLLYAANRFEEADRIFEGAVTSKPDLANAWYNWAYSAKKQNKIGEAVARLNQAVALVPADSGDFDKATQELAEWKKELEAAQENAAQQQKQAETLKTPEPLPTVNEEEKPDIPTEELAPPTEAVMPTPTAGASEGTSVSPKPSVSPETTVKPTTTTSSPAPTQKAGEPL